MLLNIGGSIHGRSLVLSMIWSLVLQLFATQETLLPRVQLHDCDRLREGTDLSVNTKKTAPPLYYAAFVGFLDVVKKLLGARADVIAEGGYFGNALQAASAHRHENVVQILLDAGADVNAKGGRYGHALQAASRHGDEKVVQMLLDAGADVHAEGGDCGEVRTGILALIRSDH